MAQRSEARGETDRNGAQSGIVSKTMPRDFALLCQTGQVPRVRWKVLLILNFDLVVKDRDLHF